MVDEVLTPPTRVSALRDALFSRVAIPPNRIRHVRVPSSRELATARTVRDGIDTLTDRLADEYERDLIAMFPGSGHDEGQERREPSFDLVLLDIGVDGRVGGLLPDHNLRPSCPSSDAGSRR